MIGPEFGLLKMKSRTSLSKYIEGLRSHNRIVPLLRGRVHILNVFIYLYTIYKLKDKSLATEFKYAYAVVYFVSIFGSIIIAWYHNNVWDLKQRALFKRVDYAFIFLSIVSPWFPVHIYYIKDWFTAAFVLLHWGLAITGVLASLIYDFSMAPKWLRVVFFNIVGQLNWHVAYKMYTSGRVREFYYFLTGTTLYFLSGIVYAAKYPNPVSRIFEHHEVMHLLVVAGNLFAFKTNFEMV
ncbi:uncharacterized protein TOT_040000698 [Theileria orientalis strain Shintoku]|uniref:Hemolysin III n=1 Tax=Theileria orientalis strain Shintoku TaxID=869250 RepID=J7M4N2_THEOR|nr:uncharacterized protein TOT_040000698 [Theileria orientalis strain Shintoku]PVC50929.1 hypothetical protein MACL_00001907 [Theileria orientalis]BAM42330.1 uncharacterized protein TOT_040000698 [Theileria orientalis strain Shintoku]|eukprot:XP_009692631.1 uncharacterized protein TOT_040000698 [Theileria orientalis strain Shintoku]